ncbi:hypothetical protein KP509_16G074500 [Ceratopteris richardii]|uniref:DCD domain-containing protein n=1 Tax=Ceratopteris richardii TaxID=49495 RepID=A0A8T2T5N9_CERRI|nr:hypothetical protein KP509_16G074500 [Ceratopteris richardii]
MAHLYSCFPNDVESHNSNKKLPVDEQHVNRSMEDQQWSYVAKKLAFQDQTRAKMDNLQGGKGIENRNSPRSLFPHNAKPAGAGYSKGSKSPPASSGKHKHKGPSEQTDMVNRMIDNLLSLDSKSLHPSQKGLLSHASSPALTQTQKTSTMNTSLDMKRFKTLPPPESLSRNETLGGYIFVCNNDTMQEDLKRQLFGLPQRYRDSVRTIQPGLPLFLYNYTTHQLHGVFEAASFGGSNIDPTAWEDKKNKGESRFPAQVKIRVRKICKPLDEDEFRPVLHHYDGPKFRLQLSVPETLALLDLCMERGA